MATKGPNDTEPLPPEPDRTIIERARREDMTDPDPRLVVPYEAPPNDNAEANEILSNLAWRRAPPPVDAPETNGDLAAAYASPARRAPVAGLTPVPEPAVVVSSEPEAPNERKAPTMRIVRPVVASEPSPETRKHRAILLVSGAAVVASALMLGAALVITGRDEAPGRQTAAQSTRPVASAATQPPAPAPSSPAAPLPQAPSSTATGEALPPVGTTPPRAPIASSRPGGKPLHEAIAPAPAPSSSATPSTLDLYR